jgi:hypothetical protein
MRADEPARTEPDPTLSMNFSWEAKNDAHFVTADGKPGGAVVRSYQGFFFVKEATVEKLQNVGTLSGSGLAKLKASTWEAANAEAERIIERDQDPHES